MVVDRLVGAYMEKKGKEEMVKKKAGGWGKLRTAAETATRWRRDDDDEVATFGDLKAPWRALWPA